IYCRITLSPTVPINNNFYLHISKSHKFFAKLHHSTFNFFNKPTSLFIHHVRIRTRTRRAATRLLPLRPIHSFLTSHFTTTPPFIFINFSTQTKSIFQLIISFFLFIFRLNKCSIQVIYTPFLPIPPGTRLKHLGWPSRRYRNLSAAP